MRRMANAIAIKSSTRMMHASLLQWYGNAKALSDGKRLHAQIIQSGHDHGQYIDNLIVHMYGKCGALDDACTVFSKMQAQNIFSWKVLIGAYVQIGLPKDVFQLFQRMQLESVLPDRVSYLIMLSACNTQEALVEGKRIHTCSLGFCIDSDVVMETAILNMYGKCGNLEHARMAFDDIHLRNVVSWNAMIDADIQHGESSQALQLFQQMQLEGSIPDKVTFGTVSCACASLVALAEGKRIHVYIAGNGLQSDVAIANALVTMYGKCGSLKDAWMVFQKMPERNVVSWSAMIAACAQHGHGNETLELFYRMLLEGVIPNQVTFISVLPVCASHSGLAENKRMHARIVGCRFASDVAVQTALFSMCSKAGSVDDAQSMFDGMSKRNVVTWNAMIAAYAQHGHCKEALRLFQQMQWEGVFPSTVTFVCVLTACSHGGLVDEGCYYFVSMNRDYGITPEIEHYDCMIDLFGRAGQLGEIANLITGMPFHPSSTSWITLLGACRMQLDVHLGKCAAECAFDLDPGNYTPYVLLSNLYAAAGMWNDVVKVRKWKENMDLKKQGKDVHSRMHESIAEDDLTKRGEAKLLSLNKQMKKRGYVPETETYCMM